MRMTEAIAVYDRIVAVILNNDAEILRACGVSDSNIARILAPVRGHCIEQREELVTWKRECDRAQRKIVTS